MGEEFGFLLRGGSPCEVRTTKGGGNRLADATIPRVESPHVHGGLDRGGIRHGM